MTITGRIVATAAVCAALFATAANAATLQWLMANNETVVVEDKVFSDFGYQTACGPDAATVDIIGQTWGPLLHGIAIQGPFVGDGAVCDVKIQYKVTALNPQQWIEDIGMSFSLSASGNGGTVVIGETAWSNNFGDGFLANSSVSIGDMQDPPAEPLQGDLLKWGPPVESVWVTKDIYLNPADAGSAVGATVIWQTFSQIPEPAHTALALLGATALGGILIKRRRG
jgi:hypothetical protein